MLTRRWVKFHQISFGLSKANSLSAKSNEVSRFFDVKEPPTSFCPCLEPRPHSCLHVSRENLRQLHISAPCCVQQSWVDHAQIVSTVQLQFCSPLDLQKCFVESGRSLSSPSTQGVNFHFWAYPFKPCSPQYEMQFTPVWCQKYLWLLPLPAGGDKRETVGLMNGHKVSCFQALQSPPKKCIYLISVFFRQHTVQRQDN